MQKIKINRSYARSYQSIEAARNRNVSTPSIETAKSLIAKKISEPSIVQQIANVVGQMLDSKEFSGYGIRSCVTIALSAYQR